MSVPAARACGRGRQGCSVHCVRSGFQCPRWHPCDASGPGDAGPVRRGGCRGPIVSLDDALLDDPVELVRIDSQRMLASSASAGGAIRSTLDADAGHALRPLVEQGRPRSLCVVGAGGSSAPGEVLAAVAGRGSPLPVFALGGPHPARLDRPDGPRGCGVRLRPDPRDPDVRQRSAASRQFRTRDRCRRLPPAGGVQQLPGGLVLAGITAQSVAGRAEGAFVVVGVVGAAAAAGRGTRPGRPTPARGWPAPQTVLDARALECGVEVLTPDNPAKNLSIHLTSGLPLAWGSGDIAAVAAPQTRPAAGGECGLAQRRGGASGGGAYPRGPSRRAMGRAAQRAGHLP
jgi:glucose/mannose-6-phosphate isomerase